MAAIFFTGTTLLFLDVTGALHAWLGWMAKIQFLPAALALNFVVVAILIAVTLIFGRTYCSVICPLGVMQDIISWSHGKMKKKNRFRFSYSPAKNILRYSILAVFIIALLAGANSFAALLAPYSSYGRIASNLLAPVYGWGNNLLAWIAERAGSYAFYSTDVWINNSHIHHCCSYIHSHIHSCMERRKDLLQHHMPGRNRSRNIFAFQHSGTYNRHVEMPQLRPMRKTMQGIMH